MKILIIGVHPVDPRTATTIVENGVAHSGFKQILEAAARGELGWRA